MSQTVVVNRGGVGFIGMLTLLFIGLKLAGAISWSWWFVLLPLYIIPAAFLGVAVGAFLLTMSLCLLAVLARPILRWRAKRRQAKLARQIEDFNAQA